MGSKVRSSLKMHDGTEVRNIEDLRKHFDLTSIVACFKSGELLGWLRERYYDEEADKIEKLADEIKTDKSEERMVVRRKNNPLSLSSVIKDAFNIDNYETKVVHNETSELDKDRQQNIEKKLCEILGVSYKAAKLNVQSLIDVDTKVQKLKELTDDEKLIAVAEFVAFDQEDLADLLDIGADTIYLCGECFNIPIREGHKHYIGILGKPLIKIAIEYADDLEDNDIKFDNATLPEVQSLDDLSVLEKGNKFYKEKKYKKAIKWFLKAAEQGETDPQMQNRLGDCYASKGCGIETDFSEAVKWYRKAMEQGDIDGKVHLGNCYLSGEGVAKDESEAFRLFQDAASHGNPLGKYRLGICYMLGSGCNKDLDKAEQLMREAENLGMTSASTMIGNIESRRRNEH